MDHSCMNPSACSICLSAAKPVVVDPMAQKVATIRGWAEENNRPDIIKRLDWVVAKHSLHLALLQAIVDELFPSDDDSVAQGAHPHGNCPAYVGGEHDHDPHLHVLRVAGKSVVYWCQGRESIVLDGRTHERQPDGTCSGCNEVLGGFLDSMTKAAPGTEG